jgi:hypothetical protein
LIFSFFEFKFKFELGGSTAGYRYRTPAVTAVTAVYRAVPSGKKNPGGNDFHKKLTLFLLTPNHTTASLVT